MARRRTLVRPHLWLMASLAIAACTGNIGDGSGDDAAVSQQPLCESPAPGANPMRRLTADQFANTVRDLLGPSIDPGDDFPAPEIEQGYRSYADANIVSSIGASDVALAAEHVALQAAPDAATLMGCDPAAAGCVDGWLATFLPRAYRRPPTTTETGVLRGAWDKAIADGFSPTESAQMLLEIVLQSPQFLYRAELSNLDGKAAGETVALDDFELASRLSYLVWDTMPDAELFALAAEGRLRDPAELEREARRLVDDPRARAVLGRFVEDWLQMYRLEGTVKDTTAFPQYGPELHASLEAELSRLVSHAVWELDGNLSTLLSAPVAVVNGPLALVYGVEGPAQADTWQAVSLDPARRAGLITSAAFLAANANAATTNPVVRGAFVRAQMLCQVLTPPPDLVVEPLAPDPNLSKREKLAQHRDDPACASCHALMDPIGFGLEHYDAIGGWRDNEEAGVPVDASGELAQAGDVSGPFDGGVELAQKLADSDLVRACVATQYFRFASGRLDAKDDSCSLGQLGADFEESGGNLRELMVALAQTDSFRYRVLPSLEETP